MTKIRFRGFPSGANISLSASQGGTTRGPVTISSWGATPNPNPTAWDGLLADETLTVTVVEVVPNGQRFAPLGIEYRISVTGSAVGNTPANNNLDWPGGVLSERTQEEQTQIAAAAAGFAVYDPTFSRVHYVLHTGDTGNYRNERVGHASHRSKAFQYGQNPGHVYTEPGTYSRSVYVYDDAGKWGVATLPDLVVTDPDDAFSAAKTIVVSNAVGETWAGAPAHDVANRCTTIDAAVARFDIIKSAGVAPNNGVRISVKSGQAFNEVTRIVAMTNTRGRCLFDIWGGTAPMLYSERDSGVLSEGGLFAATTESGWPWTIKSWTFDFGYDVYAGMPSNGWINYNARSLTDIVDDTRYGKNDTNGLRLIYDKVEVQGCMNTVTGVKNPQFVDRKSGWFFNDCIFYDNNDYLLSQASNLFFLGTQVLETYGVELGMMGRSRTGGPQRGFRGHRNIRESTAWVIYIRACFMETRGGWSGQNNSNTLYAAQPLFRHHEGSIPITRIGKRHYYCDSVFLGSFNVDSNDLMRNGALEIRGGAHFVLENNLIVFDPAGYDQIVLQDFSGRKTLRNNMLICLNTPRMGRSTDPETSGKNLSKFEVNTNSQNIGSFAEWMDFGNQSQGDNRPVEILHNTYSMLRPASDINNSTYRLYDPVVVGTTDLVSTRYNLVEGHNVNSAPALTPSVGPTMDTIDMPAGVRVLDVWMKFVWERQAFTLPNSVAPGGTTPLIPYPNDWNNDATTQASYAGTANNHSVRTESNNRSYAQLPVSLGNGRPYALDAITVNFQSSGFTVTNRHPTDTWSGLISIILHRGTTSMTPDLLHPVDQSGLKLYRPTTPQAVDAGVRSTLFDFTRTLRPGAGFAISPSAGTNAAGALLPVQ